MNDSFLGPLSAFLSAVAWAVGSTAYARLSAEYSVFPINFMRACVGLPLFFFSFLFLKGWNQTVIEYSQLTLQHLGWLLLSVLGSYGLGDPLFIVSARSLGVPAALAICASYPIWTVLLGYFWLGELVSWSQWLGLVIAFFGVFIVILSVPKQGSHQERRKFPIQGLCIALFTSTLWALNSFTSARGMSEVSTLVCNQVRMVIALLVIFVFSKLTAPKDSVFISPLQIKSYLVFFVIDAFLGSFLYVYGLSHSPLAVGAILTSLSPVVSFPIALLMKLEKFSWVRFCGVLLVVVGVCCLVLY